MDRRCTGCGRDIDDSAIQHGHKYHCCACADKIPDWNKENLKRDNREVRYDILTR